MFSECNPVLKSPLEINPLAVYQGLQTIYMRGLCACKKCRKRTSKHMAFAQIAYLHSHVQSLSENPGFPRWQVHRGESFLHIVLAVPDVVTTATARRAWHSPCCGCPLRHSSAPWGCHSSKSTSVTWYPWYNKGWINLQHLKEKGKQKHTCIHGDVCLCASWICLQAIPAKQSESAPISPQSFLFLFNHRSISENLPSCEFEFAGRSSNVINRSTRKGLTV